MNLIPLAATTLLLSTGIALADSARIINPSNNHYYQRYDKTRGWHDAQSYCVQLGGYLATITSQQEQNFVWKNFSETSQTMGIWLGASDEKQEGRWRWNTDEKWNYDNWETSEGSPNNAGQYGQHYLMLYTGKSWLPKTIISYWGDMSSLNNMAGGSDNTGHTVSTLCEWNALPDVYGQVSVIKAGVKSAKVMLIQEGQPDKTVETDNKGNYQLNRNDKSLPAIIEITLPASK